MKSFTNVFYQWVIIKLIFLHDTSAAPPKSGLSKLVIGTKKLPHHPQFDAVIYGISSGNDIKLQYQDEPELWLNIEKLLQKNDLSKNSSRACFTGTYD